LNYSNGIALNDFEMVLNINTLYAPVFLDFMPILALLQPNFANSHVSFDSITKSSTIDVLLQCLDVNNLDDTSGIKTMTFLYENFYKDGNAKTLILQPLLYFLNQETLQNLITTIQYLSIDLNSTVWEFSYTTSFNFITQSLSASQLDSYKDSTGFTLLESVSYMVATLLFMTLIILCEKIARIQKFQNAANSYLTKIINFLWNFALEQRLQLDSTIILFFFLVLYSSMMIATFDDDQEELLELFNTYLFYFFIYTFLYSLFKHSIHTFSFVEFTKVEGSSYFMLFQFFFDGFNVIALSLRFLVLMGRLNIYDGLDDILDSYYIFVADFDDDEYFNELLFSTFGSMSYDLDNHDDRSFLLEDESDFTLDLYSIYFIVWGKFLFFILFILDELGRMALAFFVTYLLVFEMNTPNRSYIEDTFLTSKNSN